MNKVDQMLLNARLRDEIEPFVDESIQLLDDHRLPLDQENEFLASMLDWERAPVLPIGDWFEPQLRPPAPETMSDETLSAELGQLIDQLFERHVVLQCTDHLSDRELYRLILRDILPAQEKRLSSPAHFLYWQCLDEQTDADIWLSCYATDLQRQAWQDEHGGELPPRQTLRKRRRLPSPTDWAR